MLFVGDVKEELHDLHPAWIVEKSCRFVEEDDRRLLRQRLGNHDLLTLTVAEARHRSVCHPLYADKTQRAGHDVAVFTGETSPEAREGSTPCGHHLPHRGTHHVGPVGEHHRHALCTLTGRKRPHIVAAKHHRAFEGQLEARDGAQQGRLACAVSANEAGEHAVMRLFVGSVVELSCVSAVGVAHNEVLECYHILLVLFRFLLLLLEMHYSCFLKCLMASS